MSTWASLFSGGKDSSYALYLAMESGREVSRLVTVHPSPDSFMYHVPATRLASLAAESIGLPLVEVEADADASGRSDTSAAPEASSADASAGSAADAVDSGARGDRELEPLEDALADLAAGVDLAGVTAGAVESEYQRSRLQAMAERLGLELYAPMWRQDARELAEGMLSAGFEVRVVQVAAEGLDESWLGRTLDREALAELERLHERHGVHLLGEGGEYETLVTDGPHMERPIDLEYDVEWDGVRGRLRITDARLA